jgi:hypothetical protein
MNATQDCRSTKQNMHVDPADPTDPKRSVRFKLPDGTFFTSPEKRIVFENAKKMEEERHPLANDPAWLAQRSSRLQNLKAAVESHLSEAPPPSLSSANFPALGASKSSNKPIVPAPRVWGQAPSVSRSSAQNSAESKLSPSPASASKGPKRLVAKLGNIRFEEHFEDRSSIRFDYSKDHSDDEYI